MAHLALLADGCHVWQVEMVEDAAGPARGLRFPYGCFPADTVAGVGLLPAALSAAAWDNLHLGRQSNDGSRADQWLLTDCEGGA